MDSSALTEGLSIADIRDLPDDELWMLYRDHLCLMNMVRKISKFTHTASLIAREWSKDSGYRLILNSD